KKPISSKIKDIIILAINVNVSFHTILVTSITFCISTTPTISAITAPIQAVQPLDNPLGGQIKNNNVNRKIIIAIYSKANILPTLYSIIIFSILNIKKTGLSTIGESRFLGVILISQVSYLLMDSFVQRHNLHLKLPLLQKPVP